MTGGSHPVKPVPNEPWPGIDQAVPQLTSEMQSRSLLSWARLHPHQWGQQPEILCFPGMLGIHCSTAGKINLGPIRCCHLSKTKILEDTFHISGLAPPQKIPPLYEDIVWGLNIKPSLYIFKQMELCSIRYDSNSNHMHKVLPGDIP